MYYILISHGEYAKETIKSAEMITGQVNTYFAVSFKENMTLEALNKTVNNILEKNEPEKCKAIITDIYGGTPFNVANKIIQEYQNIQLVTGLSISLLIFLNTGLTIEESFKDVKKNLTSTRLNKDSTEDNQDDLNEVTPTKNGIVNYRIDERLIHGQIATFWTRSLNISRVMIISDEIVQDDLEKEALKLAVPRGIKLSILTEENAVKRLNNGIYKDERVMLIVNKPAITLSLLERGLNVEEITVGNMGQKEGRERITNSVYVNKNELRTFEKIMNKENVKVYSQMVPNDEKKDFKKLIEGVL
ncbi:PTS mannose/fructose/sorbose transporter subunit IIAB [Carnobacteriaceae bacterium 52-44]